MMSMRSIVLATVVTTLILLTLNTASALVTDIDANPDPVTISPGGINCTTVTVTVNDTFSYIIEYYVDDEGASYIDAMLVGPINTAQNKSTLWADSGNITWNGVPGTYTFLLWIKASNNLPTNQTYAVSVTSAGYLGSISIGNKTYTIKVGPSPIESVIVSPIPEPATLILLGVGSIALVLFRRIF